MNAFLRGHRVLAVKKEFVPDGENSFWTFCVEYLEGTPAGGAAPGGKLPKVDYKEVLKPAEFEVFSRLREWRKGVAEKEGVPVYVVLSNEQLAQMVQKRVPASSRRTAPGPKKQAAFRPQIPPVRASALGRALDGSTVAAAGAGTGGLHAAVPQSGLATACHETIWGGGPRARTGLSAVAIGTTTRTIAGRRSATTTTRRTGTTTSVSAWSWPQLNLSVG